MARLLKQLAGKAFFGTAGALSRAGERLGWNWLVYNPLIRYGFERSARRHAPPFAEAVITAFPQVRSVADVGCGTGRFAAEFQRRGLRVIACEYTDSLRRQSQRRGVETLPFDLSKSTTPLSGSPFDLAYCLEVAEHLPASLADALVTFIVASGRDIVFTAAHPGQGGTGHVNEQPQSYWIAKFIAAGLVHDATLSTQLAAHLRSANSEPFMHENMMVFRRSAEAFRT